MNTWKCTRCETPHAAPALVMSESGLPFCNDLCKTAYERDSEVDEMCAQFDETSKRIAEWRENRQAVFDGLRADSVETINELLQRIQVLEKALRPFAQTWNDWESTAIDDFYSFDGFFNARCDWDMFAANCERAAQVIASIARKESQ